MTEHKEYKRIVSGADTALLFIHGIVGTPNHFTEFIKHVPENISVYNMLLAGHGKGVKDFSKASMKVWEHQVEDVVCKLSVTHSKIIIVAHSMGGLFAVGQAIKNKKISGLFLLALPLKLSIKPALFSNSLKVCFNRIKPCDKVASAAKECYGIGRNKNIFAYLGWIPRFIELFKKIKETRNIFNKLSTPCTVIQSSKDEMVSVKTVNIAKQNPAIRIIELKNSGHYYYDGKDFEVLIHAFVDLLN